MKYFYLILVTAFSFSCKENLREVSPCLSSNTDTITTGDSVLFLNCSTADTSLISITEIGNEQLYLGPAYNFVNDSLYLTFNDTGNFRATLRVWNLEQNAEIKEAYKSIRVN